MSRYGAGPAGAFAVVAVLLSSAAGCSGCGEEDATPLTSAGGSGGGGGAGDPCAGITCDTPPPPFCVGESTLRTYSGTGVCVDGACVFDAYDDAPCTDCCYGAEINLTGNPLGGGVGYSEILTPADATAVVSTSADLLTALASAASGAIIYVADDAEIDLSGEEDVTLPAGITLASGRGRDGSQGGLITCDTFAYPLFVAGGEGVRLTGLRLRGPNPEIGDHDYDLVVHSGAISNRHAGFEVDNCELWAWGTNAVSIGSGATDAWVHHNYIHHTRRAGYGYGVVLDQSAAVIEGNVFDACRHHIAATGRPGTSYEARYNLVLEHANGHDFDMHGAADYDKRYTMAVWRFDEGQGDVAEDSSVSGYHPQHDCTLTSMDTSTCWVTGQVNTGLAFDGVDDHLECASDSSLASPEGSIAFWVDLASVGHAASIVHLAGSSSSYLDVGVDAAGHVTVEILDGGSALVSLASSPALAASGFHHVAVTQDGVAAVVYLDGQPVGTTGTGGTSWSDHLSVASAWVGGGPRGYLDGVLDEVRIYDRALEAAEVVRHHGGNPDIAGDEILIHHNTFRDVDEHSVVIRGVPFEGASIHHNWFHLTDPASAVVQTNAQGNLVVEHNHYGPEVPLGTVLPVARAALDPAFGKAPLTTSATSRASWDPVGRIVETSWDFGDGTQAEGESASTELAAAGRYLVRGTVRDELGVRESAFVPATVSPATSGYWLDFWVKDSYPGPRESFYVKQAFVNGTQVWSDDVADDEGWTHVSVDVSDEVGGQDRAEVALRVQNVSAVANQELIELNVFWDDVMLFGGAAPGTDFEGGSAWAFTDDGASSFYGRVSAMDPHTGDWAYLINYPYATSCPAGAWGEIRQSIPLLSRELRGSWRLDEGTGSLAQDSSLYANHGSLVHMDAEAAWVDGVVSGALAFDGIDDYVDCGPAESLATTEGSVFLWLRTDGLGVEQTVFELFDSSGQNSFAVGLTVDGRTRVTARAAGSTTLDVLSQSPVSAGDFHHLAVTQSGSAVALYLDGAPVGTTGTNGSAWTGHVVPAGAWLGGGDANFFQGALDEVRIFSYALDAAEVAADFGQSRVLADWHLDDGSGATAVDSSSNGHDCTLTNMDTGSCWVTGQADGALAFDGTDDYLDCASPASISTATGTIELWFAPDTTDDDRDLVNVFEDGWENFLLVRRTANGRILLLIEDDDVAITSIQSAPVLAETAWHHVAVTQDGSGALIYVDGEPVPTSGSNSAAWTDHLAVTGIWLGGGHWSSYDGRLDEVQIWPRALRADEIAEHAQVP